MKYLKYFKLFEREMSPEWVAKNSDFYLMQNKANLRKKSEFKNKIEALISSLAIDSIKFNKETEKVFNIIFPADFIDNVSKIVELPEEVEFNIELYQSYYKPKSIPRLSFYDNLELIDYPSLKTKVVLAFMKAFPGSYIYTDDLAPLLKAGLKVYQMEDEYQDIDNVITNVVKDTDEVADLEAILLKLKSILKNVKVEDLEATLTDDTRWEVSIQNDEILDLISKYRKASGKRFSVDMDFQIESPLNRVHTSMMGLATPVQGIGLGYKMYKALINKLGYARSSYHSTNADSRKVWYHLIQDSDYYSIILNKGVLNEEEEVNEEFFFNNPSFNLEGVMIICKTYPVDKIHELVEKCQESFKTLELDDELKKIIST